MKAAIWLIRVMLGAAVLATNPGYAAEENCNGWGAAEIDPTAGRYPIELRTCDLTYGLSARIEIKNASKTRVALVYRILTNDNKYKDGDIVLEPDSITQAGNCQACAKRHAGFKSWEIKTASEATEDKPGAQPAGSAPLPAFMDKPVSAKPPAVEAPAKAPITAPPVVEAPAKAPITAPPVVEQPQKPKVPAAEPAPAAEPEKKEKEEEGFRAEDGTIIPWDQLPPEFRPRK